MRGIGMLGQMTITMGASLFALTASECVAQAQPEQTFSIKEASLDSALKAVGRQSGREIMYPADLLTGRPAPEVSGRMTADDAIRLLLRGTDLRADFRRDVVLIRGSGAATDEDDSPSPARDVVVTGTRIRGARSASPETIVSRETMRKQGITDLGSFARSLPQNYSGGQNPGVVGGGNQGVGNENVTSSSALNLRGLGPDATLTLIDGHRVAFDAVSQGIDISAIPLFAVDRVEVVTDGASAIYGSDAVGGVANVVLRKTFDGVLTSARLAGATQGGNTQYQFDGVTGADWTAGRMMAALSYSSAGAITARQRSFTRSINGSATLLPQQDQVSGVLTAEQQLGAGFTFDIDAQFSRRRSFRALPFTAEDSYSVTGSSLRPRVGFFAVSPSLRMALPAGWELTASGSYSKSDTAFTNRLAIDGAEIFKTTVRYNDRLIAGELGAEGPLFAAPGSDVRLGIGGGHRSERLTVYLARTAGSETSVIQAFEDAQHVTFAYGEIFVPLVEPINVSALAQRLELSAAARYERYAGSGGLVTPKFGLVYAPFSSLVLKGTYGRSFKAPTLYQLNNIRNGGLIPAAFLGETPPVDVDAVALVGGGNPDLTNEKATTWSATAQYSPAWLHRLVIEATYYHINFTDRVVEPFASLAGVLTNPEYRQLVVFSPTASQLAAFEASVPGGLTNQTGLPVSALNVVALIDDSVQNAASQAIQGVDVSIRYDAVVHDDERLTLAVSANYLKIDQRLNASAPTIEQTGFLFRPPHWRARGSAEWDRGAIGATAVISYVGSTIDPRFDPMERGKSFTTLDIVGRFRAPRERGLLAGVEANLSVLNVFDRKPGVIRNSDPSNPPYDSTNYSAVGRVVSLTLLKRW